MADVSGPCSTLPGSHHRVPTGVMCDDHSDRPATHRVQGETDSFGAEYHDMCDECYAEHKKAMEESKAERATGTCDWCKRPAFDLRPRRDFEEGMGGPVYDVCGACVKAENERLEEELSDRDDDYWDAPSYLDEDEDDWELDEPEDPGIDVEAHSADQDDQGQPLYPGARAYVDGKYIYR
jgi:hypothetical protein